MRIIAGIAKGMPLHVPSSGVRPTADRTRAAIFSRLGQRVAGARVLDLFAGTGALGLEAASRGAASVMFVESSRSALQSLERNVTSFQKNRETKCRFRIVRGPVQSHLQKLATMAETFYLIFADPPYGDTAQELLLDHDLPQLLDDEGELVLESARRKELKPMNPWEQVRESTYGDTRISILRVQRQLVRGDR